MAGGLDTLLQALLGGAAGGFRGYAEGQQAKQQQREREAEQKRLQDQFDRQMRLSEANAAGIAEERDYDRTRTNYADLNPNTDLTTNPNLEKFRKYGFGLTETPAVSAPKLSNSFTLPSMPSSTPSSGIGGAASTPMVGGKYDPAVDETPEEAPTGAFPKPLPMGGPITVGTPTYGLGTPGKVTRQETRQESLERVDRENQIAMLENLLPQVGKQYAPIFQSSIDALKKGGKPMVTAAAAAQLIQESQPKPPAASAQPDFEFQTAFQIANGKKFDEAATPQELAAANRVLAQQRINGTRAPQGSSASAEPNWQTLEVTGPDGKSTTAQVNPKTGEVRPLTLPEGVTVARGTKPPNGAQNRAHTFFMRAKEADETLATVADVIANSGLKGQVEVSGWVPNMLQSDEAQQYMRAQRAFTEARLRKDSGAAIPPHEFENDRKMYFEQPGDSPKVRADKAHARKTVLESLASESGPAYQQYSGEAFRPGQFTNTQTGTVTLVAPNGEETTVSEAEAKRIMAADPLVKRKGQ